MFESEGHKVRVKVTEAVSVLFGLSVILAYYIVEYLEMFGALLSSTQGRRYVLVQYLDFLEGPIIDSESYLIANYLGSLKNVMNWYTFQVEVGTTDRADFTCPPCLRLYTSKITGAGRGVWTNWMIPKNSRFGPYEGDVIRDSKEAEKSGYAWMVSHTDFCCFS